MRRQIRSSGKVGLCDVVTSHDSSEGRINLYAGSVCDENWMSDADLAVLDAKGRVVSIVEVKHKDVRPKDILGVVLATSLCSVLSHRGRECVFARPVLYIVADSEIVDKPGSAKGKQLQLINTRLRGCNGSLRKVVICGSRDFSKRFRV